MPRTKNLGKALIVTTLMLWSFVAGWAFHSHFAEVPGEGPQRAALLAQASGADVEALAAPGDGGDVEPLWILWEVLSQIRHNYYEPITKEDETALAYGAAKGMARALGDPYSDFMEPVVFEEFSQDTQGFLEGIGAELVQELDEQTSERKIVVHKPLRGGPAAEAGMMPGDWIVGIDDEVIQGQGLLEVVTKIRGERGSTVKISVVREGEDELVDFEIQRARVELPVVDYRMLNDTVGYLLLEQFNDRSLDRMQDGLKQLEAQGMKTLVFDLRDNTGGTLDAAVEICSLFVEDKPVLYVQERGAEPKAMGASSRLYRGTPPPMVLLVNGQTASASEIVAGALQDYELATLVGARTFGKGLVQTVVPLHDPSVRIKLTTAKWLTPLKRYVNKKLPAVIRRLPREGDSASEEKNDGGLVPDYEVEMSMDLLLERARGDLADADDPQLQKALEVAAEQQQ